MSSPTREEIVTLVAEEMSRRYGQQMGLVRVAGLALLVAVGLVAVDAWQWHVARTTPMHYTAAQGPGIAQPNVIGDDYALEFATRWLEVRWTFQPKTLASQQERIRPWLHPRLTKDFDVQAADEQKLVKQVNMSCLTVVQSKRVLKRQGPAIFVELVAQRDILLGDRKNRAEEFKAVLVLVPFPEGGQTGTVVVWGQQVEPALSLAGK